MAGWSVVMAQMKILFRRNGFAYNTIKIDKAANEYEDVEDSYSKTNIAFYRN